ncbi:HDOD domain-containing protein [Alteromonas ponticola]|uniref:HDOD domain-containing protein n=1 Tax=Alteromonas aquimaris TaxID=2998417 RepID=A0ABT3P4K0_9ALTE|nr:helix-turn-helix domain-containing protein [Alteromonas aquimaris]MCW8107694.1 HDOD domain-containing protein [Alteromonas aquimaris]
MYNRGLFWSAIIRSLLALRRDQQWESEAHEGAIGEIAKLENGRVDLNAVDQILYQLIPQEHVPHIGNSLAGYLDFNKMGNFTVLLTSLRTIHEVLETLSEHYQLLLGNKSYVKYEVKEEVKLSCPAHEYLAVREIEIYFLFIVCRHLAGRKFDFNAIQLPAPPPLRLVSALSKATITNSDGNITLTFNPMWLNQTSFYHSAQLVKMLKERLASLENISLKTKLHTTFSHSEKPARIRIDWVAEVLGTTESSLRKQLRQETLSFNNILKSYIHELSSHHLLAGKKSETIAELLGFSDRRTFERSFKEYSGISAGQVRQLGSRLRFHRGNNHLINVVDNLPPLPDTIAELIALDHERATVERVVSIIEQDPIFYAHIMSKASRAVFGSVPKTLHQAVGRNLGVSNIKHLAVVFAAQQLLTMQCRHPDVHKLTDAMLLSLTLYQSAFAFDQAEDEDEVTRQMLVFGLLSLFIVFHEECMFVEGTMHKWDVATNFAEFSESLNKEFGVCLYGATTLMLLRWGFKSSANHRLWKLCKESTIEENEINRQILICHNLAFSATAFTDKAKVIEILASLKAEQKSRLLSALERWQTL